MHFFLSIIVHTTNILGGLTDPFEFAGDYGAEINPIRNQVFERVVPREALAINPSNEQKKALALEDAKHGPLLEELVSQPLINLLITKQRELSPLFSENDCRLIIEFLNRFKSEKVFRFLKTSPIFLLDLDKPLRDKDPELPILGSIGTLRGESAEVLKKNLFEEVFTKETLELARDETFLKKSLDALDPHFLSEVLKEGASNSVLEVFCRPAGQAFFLWLAQSLNLHLIADPPSLIEQVNKVKRVFAKTLGDPLARAEHFKKKYLEACSEVIFTQESDSLFPQVLASHYLPPVDQNPQDGCFVLLKKEVWLPSYEIIPLPEYEGYRRGKITAILATYKATLKKYLLATCHGKSTDASDGRNQISHVMTAFLSLRDHTPDLQLIIGIDANTKNDEEVKALHHHLKSLDLIGTQVGPTTVKRRMVTVQNAKAGRIAIDTEDFIITLNTNSLIHQTVGFSSHMPSSTTMLPNIYNPSDHYPVGAEIKE